MHECTDEVNERVCLIPCAIVLIHLSAHTDCNVLSSCDVLSSYYGSHERTDPLCSCRPMIRMSDSTCCLTWKPMGCAGKPHWTISFDASTWPRSANAIWALRSSTPLPKLAFKVEPCIRRRLIDTHGPPTTPRFRIASATANRRPGHITIEA